MTLPWSSSEPCQKNSMDTMTDKSAKTAIAALTKPRQRPDGTPYKALSTAAVRQLAQKQNMSIRRIEIAALKAGIVPERYTRNFNTFALTDQVALLEAHVAVIGLGGLGGGVVEMLARTGVGILTLVDGDAFDDSNLNRQFLSGMDTLGSAKALAAGKRVAAVNPAVETRVHERFMKAENAGNLLSSADLVIDCLDSVDARFMLEDAARKTGIALVSGAVAGTSGQVTVVFPGDPGLRLVYGNPGEAPDKGAETKLGTVSAAVTLIAALQCSEAIKILLGQKSTLQNRLLLMDMSDNSFETISLV